MKHRIVILEGPDGAGKTTLAKQIADHFGNVAIIHNGPPPADDPDLFGHYYEQLSSVVSTTTAVTVFDRLYAGERIYGPVARGKDRLGNNGFFSLNEYCRVKNILRVLCLPNGKQAIDNYIVKMMEKDDYLKDLDRFQEVYWRYKAIAHYHDIVYDYEFDNFNWIKVAMENGL